MRSCENKAAGIHQQKTAEGVREFNSCCLFPAGNWLTFVEIALHGTQLIPKWKQDSRFFNSIGRLGIGQMTALPRIAEIENQSDRGPGQK
jgi:hypothetical protein